MKKCIVVIGIVLVVVLITGIFLIQNGVIITDYSARLIGNTLEWNNRTYHPFDTGMYSEGKTIAIASDSEGGRRSVNEVTEDSSHTFIVLRTFLDERLYVAEDYTIPTEGRITCAYWGWTKIDDMEFYNTISEILATPSEIFEYETDYIYALTDTQKMKKIYVGYEDCPIGTDFKGYLGKINGKWVITIPYLEYPDGYELKKPQNELCCLVDDRFTAQLEKYFEEVF